MSECMCVCVCGTYLFLSYPLSKISTKYLALNHLIYLLGVFTVFLPCRQVIRLQNYFR